MLVAHEWACTCPARVQVLRVQDLYTAINTVKDESLIRVESDEVTYPLHVIIRYEVRLPGHCSYAGDMWCGCSMVLTALVCL